MARDAEKGLTNTKSSSIMEPRTKDILIVLIRGMKFTVALLEKVLKGEAIK